jgi:ABC-type branched-subunit amino acid transport system permease subunit
VLGLLLLMRAGLVSFGQGLYYCLGAYAAGLAGHFLGVTDAVVLLGFGMGACLVMGALLGILLSQYREIFFAMLSLALSMILFGLLTRSSALGSTDGFNLAPATFLGYAPTGTASYYALYALTCLVTLSSGLAMHRYLQSTMGYLATAVRDNEVRVEYLGASVRQAVYVKYVLAAVVAGMGGVLTALTVGHIDPDMAYWTTSGEFVFITILGGTTSVAAPFVSALLFEVVRSYAYQYSPYTWQMVLGTVMLLVIIFLPGGLWTLFALRQRRA